MIFINKKCNFL